MLIAAQTESHEEVDNRSAPIHSNTQVAQQMSYEGRNSHIRAYAWPHTCTHINAYTVHYTHTHNVYTQASFCTKPTEPQAMINKWVIEGIHYTVCLVVPSHLLLCPYLDLWTSFSAHWPSGTNTSQASPSHTPTVPAVQVCVSVRVCVCLHACPLRHNFV